MIKKSVIAVIIIFALLSIYFGSYLPLVKAQRFISALRAPIQSIGDFKNNFNHAFDFYSPIGDEEAFKFLSSHTLRLISLKGQPEEVMREVVTYIEPQAFMNDVRHLLNLASIYVTLWRQYDNDADFQKAITYYEQILAIGPKLPHALYGLLDLYRLKGDTEKMREISEIILKYWPNDERVKQVLESTG